MYLVIVALYHNGSIYTLLESIPEVCPDASYLLPHPSSLPTGQTATTSSQKKWKDKIACKRTKESKLFVPKVRLV